MRRVGYIALGLLGILLFLYPFAVWHHFSKECPGEIVKISVHDSIVYRDTSFRVVAKAAIPKNIRVGKVRSFVSTRGDSTAKAIVCSDSALADTFFYQKEIRQANFFKVKLDFSVVDSRIVSWNEAVADLRSDTIKIVERRYTGLPRSAIRSAFIKGFLGIHGGYGETILKGKNVDVGPSGALLFADRYLVNYDYSVRNNYHQVGFLVKLQFKK